MLKSANLAHPPNHHDFVELVGELSSYGISQRDLAERLSISPGQISRIKKGERPATERHLSLLRAYISEFRDIRRGRERSVGDYAPLKSVWSIDTGVLTRLSASGAIEAFRALLLARTASRGLRITAVNISSKPDTADGGVDASVSAFEHAAAQQDELLGCGTRFQIKTGAFAPWQQNRIKSELFGKKSIRFENLGTSVQNALKSGYRFVLVCFGVDPNEKQLIEANSHLRTFFTQCGYSDAKVEIWGQSHLIGLYHEYPSLCLRLRGYDREPFRTHSSWSQDEDMQPELHHGPEIYQLLCELKQQILSGEVSHLRLLGEPGVGKTRLALEITRDEQLAPLTIYVREGRALLQSTFINELIQRDDHRFLVFVVDECNNKDISDLWNRLKSNSGRIRIISIDHGPDDSVDDRSRTVQLGPLGKNEIASILTSHGIDRREASRWSEFCEGCPRVAHVLGDNLRHDRSDLLQIPGTVDVWNRFVVGHDSADSYDVRLRKVVLRHIALFEKFGFEAPVSSEAQYIATLAASCEPGLTWGNFQSIVADLKKRRILQGATTLYVTPRLLHIHLLRDFWGHYGAGFDFANALTTMPPSLRNWFLRMFRYTHNTPGAEGAVHSILENRELFPCGRFPNQGESGRLVEILSEVNPKAVLRCLQRTIGEMDIESLKEVRQPRQLLVWALEKIAVWKENFADAAFLLLLLAEAENSSNGNNATDTFTRLFSLIPGLAATQAYPATRLAFLEKVLVSDSKEQRRLGLKACAKALDTMTDFRMVGPEHQGLRKRLEFWMPSTRDELWNCHRDVWEFIVRQLETWQGEDRKDLISTLVASAWSTLHIAPLTSNVIDTLQVVSQDPQTDISELAGFARRQLCHPSERLSAETLRNLHELYESLEGHDFSTRLRRFVRFICWDDVQDADGRNEARIAIILNELADEAVENPELLEVELPWLTEDESSSSCYFAHQISVRDPNCRLYELIVSQFTPDRQLGIAFLTGYLAGVFHRNPCEWEERLNELSESAVFANRFSDIVISSGISESMAKKVVEHCRNGRQSTERLERWWFDNQIKTLSHTTIADIIGLHLEAPSQSSWCNAVQTFHTYYMDGEEALQLPEDLTFDLLLHESITNRHGRNNASYYWSRLALAFLNQYPSRKWEFFGRLLKVGSSEWSLLCDLSTFGEPLISDLLREDPEKAFAHIAEVVEDEEQRDGFALGHWLAQGRHHAIGEDDPGPIQYIPSSILFAWVDKDIQRRGAWLAHILPKTLDESVAGRLTRDFIARYGNDRGICASLNAHFNSRGWCGKESDHHRSLRDEARTWLIDERNNNVIRWVEKYIDGLTYSIDRAEIDEEREV